jgi:hypothetical protein
MKLTVSQIKRIRPDPDRDLVLFDDELRGFGRRMKPSGGSSPFARAPIASSAGRRASRVRAPARGCRW